jgi:polygalacturonase
MPVRAPAAACLAFAFALAACGADAGALPGAPATPGAEPPPAPGADGAASPGSDGGPGAAGDAATDGAVDGAAPVMVCDPRAYGAKADGKTKDTAALQAAIEACAPTGGVVELAHGTFLSGMITLRSRITLRIDADATLKGTQDDADYPSTNPPTTNTQLGNCRKTLVYAESAHDVRIDGGGTIDGNGNTPKWIGPSSVHPESTRPMAIYTALATNVTIDGIKVTNAAMWGVVNLETENLTIRNVTVDSTLSGNRDGIDVVDAHHVLIENVTITSEDDSICLKSGSRRGVDDVLVRSSHVVRSIVANALKLGTASYGSFTNVTFQDIVIDHADKAAMAVESVDGADISGIAFRRIQFKDVGSPFFVLLGDRGSTPAGDVHKVGTVDGVSFEDVTGSGSRYDWASPISGTKTPDGVVHTLKNLSFTNVNVTNKGGLTAVPADPPEYHGEYPDPNLWGNLPAFGFFIRHASGVAFKGTTTLASPADARKPIETRDVQNLTTQ